MSNLKTPTLEDQMKHIKKIETLLEKFKDKRFPGLTEDEVFTIVRALSCHDAVIRFDIKKRGNNERFDKQKISTQSIKTNHAEV